MDVILLYEVKGEIRECSFITDEPKVEEASEARSCASLPEGEALVHDAATMRNKHEGDEGGHLEEDPQRACVKLYARVPVQKRECHLQSFDQGNQGQDPLKVIRLEVSNPP